MTMHEVFTQTDWALLARQKLALLEQNGQEFDGLINWLDAIQDAAAAEGFPVVWLGDTDDR